MTDNTPTEKEFYDLFINNKDFNAVAQHVNRFNPIRVMNMEHMEIRHSAILVWLLNPNENHGLGDIFLKQFLASAVKNSNKTGETKIPVLDIMTTDLNDAIVMSEYQCDGGNIDIVIECPNNNWVFVIENKIHADEGKDQLKRYTSIKKVYPDYKHSFIFLTKEGNSSDCPSEQANLYHPASHKQVLALLQNIIKTHKDRFSTEISLFIQHYIDTLKEVLGMIDIELQRKVRKLYHENKKVIDFIMHNKDKTMFENAIKKYIKKHIKNHEDMFAYTHVETSLFIFVPKEWAEKLDKNGKELELKYNTKYWKHKYPFMCYLQLYDLGNNSYKLYSQIEFMSPEIFKTTLKDIGNFITDLSTEDFIIKQKSHNPNWIKCKTEKSITIDVLNKKEMYKEIQMWFKDFKKNVIDKITEELPKWIKE